MQFWKEMEGKTVAGRYALGTLLRYTAQSAWFATKDERQKPAVVFLTNAGVDEEQVLKNLEAAARVKHANVVGIEKTGRARVEDNPLVYAILEPTEENLSEVLKERALTPEETAQITGSLVAGLTAIHEQGLFHGHVDPAYVAASGDTVKLSSDCLLKPSAEGRADAFAQDTGDLGATVFQALTQRKLTSPDDPAIDKLPVPFRSIVHSAVSGRWGLADIATALKKPGLGEIRHPIPNTPTSAKPKFAEEAAGKSASPRAATEPASEKVVFPARVEAPSGTGLLPEPGKGKNTGVRVAAIIALLAVIGVLWFFYHSHAAGTDAAEPTAATTAAPTPAQTPEQTPAPAPAQVPAPATETAAPVAQPHTPAPHTPVPNTAEPPAGDLAGDHKIWRVVVYTFRSKTGAERKVAALVAKHPDLKPEVFSAKGDSPWLVTVGGPMDHAQAVELRGQVRSQGMPGDSYVQNYSH